MVTNKGVWHCLSMWGVAAMSVAVLTLAPHVTISADQASSSKSKVHAGSGVAVFDPAKLFSTSVYVQKKGASFQVKMEKAQAVAAEKTQTFHAKWKKEAKKLQALQGSLSEKSYQKKQEETNKKYQKELQELQKQNGAVENKIKSAYQGIMMGIHKHVKAIIALLVEKRSQTSRPIHVVLTTEERTLWYYDPSTVVDLTDEVIERLDQIPLEEGDDESASKPTASAKE